MKYGKAEKHFELNILSGASVQYADKNTDVKVLPTFKCKILFSIALVPFSN